MVVQDIAEALKILKKYSTSKQISLDTETRGEIVDKIEYSALILPRARLLTIQMKSPNEEAHVFVSDELGKQFLPLSKILPIIKEILENPNILKVYHNANYDINVFRNYGIVSRNNYCTMIAGACYDENMSNSLKDRAVLVGMLLKRTRTIDFENVKDLTLYGEEDVIATDKLKAYYSDGRKIRIIGKKNTLDVSTERLRGKRKLFYEKQEMPILNVVIKMEQRGVRIDLSKLRKIDEHIQSDISDYKRRIFKLAGEPFKISSPQQLSEVLFTKLGLEPPEDCKTKGGATSVNQRTMFYLLGKHDIIEWLIKFKKANKLREVYTNPESGLPYYCDERGIIKATANNVGTHTFRFSYSNPNLQTIPSKTDTYGIRDCFIAPIGRKVAVYDFSQIEVRMQAICSRDPAMVAELSKPKGDIYLRTAQGFSSPNPDDERDMYKVVVLALQYGMGPYLLADNMTMQGYPTNKHMAKSMIKHYFWIYQAIPKMWYRLFQEHEKNGFVTTLLGRPRAVRDFETKFDLANISKGMFGLNPFERALVNNWMQGSTADWIKQSMLRIENHDVTVKGGYRQSLQIHDEVFGTVPEKGGDELFEEVKELAIETPDEPFAPTMELSVPIKVEGSTGSSWADCKKNIKKNK